MKTKQSKNKACEFIISSDVWNMESLKDYYWFCKIKNREYWNKKKIDNLKNNTFKNSKIFDFQKSTDFKKAKRYFEACESPKRLKELINESIPYSFGIWIKFKLKQPYFSKDDEEFYLIQNPILKDKVFKVPMIRGSGWKGAIANAGREIIKEKDREEFWKYVFSYIRIFGTGNEEFRELMEILNKNNKDNDNVELKKSLANYVLFNIGAQINLKDLERNLGTLVEKYFNEFKNKFVSSDNNKKYYEAKKGRAIFYPTYFDRLSLEVINPHSRKTRAGINPIHYEVVPKGAEGILQIVYIPFDGILKKYEELKEEVERDLKFLCECIERIADLGVGAKTKLGWGTFEITQKKAYSNKDIEIPEGWINVKFR